MCVDGLHTGPLELGQNSLCGDAAGLAGGNIPLGLQVFGCLCGEVLPFLTELREDAVVVIHGVCVDEEACASRQFASERPTEALV